VAAAGVNALAHFNTFGFHEGREPVDDTSTRTYYLRGEATKSSWRAPNRSINFHQFGWKEARDHRTGLRHELYLLHQSDVAAAAHRSARAFSQSSAVRGRQAYAAIGTAVNGFDAILHPAHPDVAAALVIRSRITNANVLFTKGATRRPNSILRVISATTPMSQRRREPAAALRAKVRLRRPRIRQLNFDTLGYLERNPTWRGAVTRSTTSQLRHLRGPPYRERRPVPLK